MKADKDIIDEVMGEMAINGTLTRSGDSYYPSDNVDLAEIEPALVERLSARMNDEIWESSGKAVIHENDVTSRIEDGLERFGRMITDSCKKLGIKPSKMDVLKAQLKNRLDKRFLIRLSSQNS